MLVCKLGHETLMHQLVWWQVRAAVRGAYRDTRATWESARWHAWTIVSLLAEKGSSPKSPKDMMRFAWEDPMVEMPSDDEIEEVRRSLREANAKRVKN